MCMNMQPLLQQTFPFYYVFDHGKLDVSLPAIAINLYLEGLVRSWVLFL